MKIDTVDILPVAQQTIDSAFKFWEHYNELFHVRQISSAKNYLWLSVTELTALFACNERFSLISENALLLAFIVYDICIALSSAVLLCGISCLSEVWGYGKQVPQPYSEHLWLIKDAKSFGADSNERLQDLTDFCKFLDTSIQGTIKQINKRAHRLRFMSFCMMLAVILGLLFLFLTI